MIRFLLIVALVIIVVDLFVRFIIDPMIIASHKKAKTAKSDSPKFNPMLKLATETMYDGGKPHNNEETAAGSTGDNSKDKTAG